MLIVATLEESDGAVSRGRRGVDRTGTDTGTQRRTGRCRRLFYNVNITW